MKLRCISKNRDQQHETKAKNITNDNKQKLCNGEKKKVKTPLMHCFHKSHGNINNGGDKSKDSYMNSRNKSSKQPQLNQQHWKKG